MMNLVLFCNAGKTLVTKKGDLKGYDSIAYRENTNTPAEVLDDEWTTESKSMCLNEKIV